MSDDKDDLRAWARAEARDVFAELLKLAMDEAVSATKLAAIREVLDRGYGKAGAHDAADMAAQGQGPMEARWAREKSEATPDPSAA